MCVALSVRWLIDALTIAVQQIGQQIGKGGFATVHKAINLITGEVVAAKRFDATQVSKSALATITVRPPPDPAE